MLNPVLAAESQLLCKRRLRAFVLADEERVEPNNPGFGDQAVRVLR